MPVVGSRGPKPKPTAVRIFEGNPGNIPLNKDEPKFALADIAPPEFLGDIGKAKWIETAPLLVAVGLLTQVDRDVLAMYCEAFDELFTARAIIEEHGMISVSSKGGEYQHPAVGIKNKAIQRIKQFGALLGLNPVSRMGLKVRLDDGPDELEAFKRSG